MRDFSRMALAMLLVLVLATCSRGARGQIIGADALPGALPDLTGTYAVNGTDPLGTEYRRKSGSELSAIAWLKSYFNVIRNATRSRI